MNRCRLTAALFSVLAALAPAGVAPAEVRLPKIFTNNMVLQQKQPIVIWGWADPGERVAARLGETVASTRAAKDGTWRVELAPMIADGKSHVLFITGAKNTLSLQNVLLGELWLCSGQSNMGRPVGGKDADEADFPHIRLFESDGNTPRLGDLDSVTGWHVCTPETVKSSGNFERGGKRRGFSEVAFLFGRKLHTELKVPVGLMQVNCGGSTAKDWTPLPGIEKQFPYDKAAERPKHTPGLLYHIRMRGLVPLAIRGVIWYQGEDDGRNRRYAQDLKALIGSWRKLWGRPELPFYFVQIAPTGYASGMLGVWEAQQWVMNHVPHTGMAVSNDIYDGTTNGSFKVRTHEGNSREKPLGWPIVGSSNPHPPNKHIVAGRLAEIALVEVYGKPERVRYGPMYDSHTIDGAKVLVKFKHIGTGLASKDGKPLNWFQLSDGSKDGRKLAFHKAQAKIVAPDTVEVTCPELTAPKFVRFGWHNLARYNLMNTEGLPAVSFRTDTEPR